jgi:hypothetical protein
VQCQDTVHGAWFLYANIEGLTRNTQNEIRCKGSKQNGLHIGDVIIAKSYFGGSSQASITVGPLNDVVGPVVLDGSSIAWDNRFIGMQNPGGVNDPDGPGVSWTNDNIPNPCNLNDDGNPAFASDNQSSSGHQTGTSDDVGFWDANQCNATQSAVTNQQKDDVADWAGDIEDYVSQIRAAAGY